MAERSQVGVVSLGVNLDSSKLDTQANKLGNNLQQKFGNISRKIGRAFAVGLSVTALVKFSKKCLELGSDLQEVQNVVDSTFTSMSGKIDEFAKNAATQFGLSETMAKRYAGTFGAMGKAFGFAEKDAAEMSMALTGLAGDVASFYNIDQDAAYTKLKSVFTGETESLKDLGVVMTQTALDQYALQNGFGRTTKSMSEQEKVALRYRFVLDKLSTASGDFARTSGGWANQVRLLKLQFESLSATIGQVLIAALTPAIRALNSFMGALVKAANTFKSFIFSLFGLESEDMKTGSAAVTDAMYDIGDSTADASDGLGNVGDAASDAADDTASAAKKIQRSLAGFDQITKLTDQTGGSGSSGGSGNSGGSGTSGGSGNAGGLGDTSSALKDTAYSVASENGPLSKIQEKLLGIKDLFIDGFWEGFGDTAVLTSIKTHIDNIKSSLDEIFGTEKSRKALSDWFDSLVTLCGRVSGAAASVAATIVDNLLGGMDKWLTKNGDTIASWWQNMLGAWTTINDKVGELAIAIADIFSVFRSDDAKNCTSSIINMIYTPISNTLLLVSKFGSDFLTNVVKIVTDNKEKIKTALEGGIGRLSTILETIDSTASRVWGNIQKLYDDHISPIMDDIGDTMSDILGNLLDGWNNNISPVLDKLSKKFKDVMEDHVDPMLDSISDAIGAIFDLTKDLWDKVLDPLFKWISEHIMPVLAPIVELLGDTLLDALADASDNISAIARVIEKIATGLQTAIETITDFIDAIKKIPEKISAVLELVFGKDFNSNKTVWDSLEDENIFKIAGGTLAQSFKNVFGEDGKSGSFMDFVKDGVSATKSAVGRLGDGFSTVFGEKGEGGYFAKFTEKGIGATKSALGKIGSGFSNWFGDKGEGGIFAKFTDKGVDATKYAKGDKDAKGTFSKWFGDAGIGGIFAKFTSSGVVATKYAKGDKDAKGTFAKWFGGDGTGGLFGKYTTSGRTAVKYAKGAKDGKGTFKTWFGGDGTGGIFGKYTTDGRSATKYADADRTDKFNEVFGKDGAGGAFSKVKGKTVTVKVDVKYDDTTSKHLGEYAGMPKAPGGYNGGIFRNGSFHPFTSFASGGFPHGGQLFRARENGNPELVGTLRGSTAVMNNNQIVASVSSGVAKAISNIRFHMEGIGSFKGTDSMAVISRFTPPLAQAGIRTADNTGELVQVVRELSEASAGGSMVEVMQILKDILYILQHMDFDVKMDGASVKDRIVRLINANTRATGRCEIVC